MKYNKRDREYCRQCAMRCETMDEFWHKEKSAATKAKQMGWIGDYDWLRRSRKPAGTWTEEACREESRKYETVKDFRTGSPSAHAVSQRNGWIYAFTWLKWSTNRNGRGNGGAGPAQH